MNRRRVGAAAVALVAGALVLSVAPSRAEVAEAKATYESWFFRAKPESPIVQTPNGPVSAGPDFPPAPQDKAGGFVVSFAGGNPGQDNGDTGWTAFQFDTSAAQGGSVDEFVLTLVHDPGNRGDFGTPVLRACNIVSAWAASPAANPWSARPSTDCTTAAIPPKVGEAEGNDTYTFDITSLAKSWLDGRGEGVMIQPGDPTQPPPNEPFQLTVGGYTNADEKLRPKVTFRYTTAEGDSLGSDSGFGGLDASIGSDASGGLISAPALDVFPSDVGSTPDSELATPTDSGATAATGASPATETAAPRALRRAATSKPGFPVAGWLLLPLMAIAFWGACTALGDAGEPIQPRAGGVSRVLAERRAARTGAQA